MENYNLYLQKVAELDQMAQDIINEIIDSIEDAPPLKGVRTLSKNMCIVRFSSLANLSAETHLIEVQKEVMIKMLKSGPRHLDVVFKKLRTICKEGRVRDSGSNSYIYLHPEFVKYLATLLPEETSK